MRVPPRAEWQRLYRYWVRDPAVGARLLAAHNLLRVMPTGTVSAIGAWLAPRVAPRFHAAADRRARAALHALRPDLVPDAAALDRTMWRVWDGIGRVYAEFSAEDRLFAEGRVAVEGEDNLIEARAGGRPLIVAGIHLANWELPPIVLGYLGHKLTDVYQPPRNRFEDRIAMRTRLRVERRFVRVRPEAGLRLLPPGRGVGPELLRALRGGQTLMMYVDESHGGRVYAPAFGRPMRTDGNLARVIRLARLADASVVPAYAHRSVGARFTVRFLPPLVLQKTAYRDADMRANIATLDAAITSPVLAHLDQWYMLIDFRIDR